MARLGTGLGVRGLGITRDIDIAFFVIPGRYLMAPPQLTADAPVADVAHPFEVGLGPVLGHKFDPAVFHSLDGRTRQRLYAHIPLVGEQRLEDGATAITARHHQLVLVDVIQQSCGVELCQHLRAGRDPVEAAQMPGYIVVQTRIGRQDVEHRQVMALAHVIVGEVMRRRDLDATGAELAVDEVIADDRDQAAGDGQADLFADQMTVALIFRVHSHSAVTEHGFRACGGDHQVAAAVLEWIAQVPQAAFFFCGQHFQVAERGQQHRVPIDQPLAAVDEALFVQAHEHFGDRARQRLVHGKALARPVDRGTHAAQLLGDGAAGLALPFPHSLDEFLAAQVAAAESLGVELALDHHLRGDAGMVGAHLP